MNKFDQFQSAIELQIFDDTSFTIIPDSRYFVGNTPHGGYLTALMHKSLTSLLPHSVAISSSVQFLDRIDAEEVKLIGEVFRLSKGSSSGIIKLMQNNKVCATFTGTCSDFEYMKGINDLSTELPKIFNSLESNKYQTMNYDKISKGFTPSFVKQLNCEVHPDHAWWTREEHSKNNEARCSAFLEMDGGIPDQFCLSFYSDIVPPVVTNKYGPLGWVPTITLTTHIRQMPTTQKLFADFKASEINKGYFEQNGNIWDLNKNLVASSRQLTRILKSEEKIVI